MSMTSIPPVRMGPFVPFQNGSTAFSTVSFTFSGIKIGWVFQVEEAGTLDWFEICTGSVTNNPDTGLRFSFQDLTSGNPDGTQDQFRDLTGSLAANTWQGPGGVMTNDGTNGGTKRTVARGDWLACVIQQVSFTAGDSFIIRTGMSCSNQARHSAYYVLDTGGGYAKQASEMPNIALKYSDGTYKRINSEESIITASALNATSFNTGSTPDERALRFVINAQMRIIGAYVRVDPDNAANLVLYDSGSSALQTKALSTTNRQTTSEGWAWVPFDTPQTLTAGATYRLSLKPTTGSNIIGYDYTINASGLLAANPGGADFYFSSRTDAGAWSDSQTTVPFICPVFDQVDVVTSSGGGSFANFG